MSRSLALSFIFASIFASVFPGLALAAPHTFSAGTPAQAAQVNENFTAVESRLDVLEAAAGNEPWHWTLVQFEYFYAALLSSGTASFSSVSGKTHVSTGSTASSAAGIISQNNDAIVIGANNPGSYLATFAKWEYLFEPEHTSYILAGGMYTYSLATFGNGYGFKAEGEALKGVVINGFPGTETTLNLNTTLVAGDIYRLRAVVRSSNSIEFFVNGVSKGTLSGTTIPDNFVTMFRFQVSNGASATNNSLSVGGLSLGVKD